MRHLGPRHPSYSEEYWGTECGTPEVEASMRCVKCWLDLAHPWHDSGEPNSEHMVDTAQRGVKGMDIADHPGSQ